MLITKKSRRRSAMFDSKFRDGTGVDFPVRQYLRCREDMVSGIVHVALLAAFGLHDATAVLAIAIPFTGTFAKVFAEIAEETPSPSAQAAPRETGWASRYLYIRLPDLWPH